MNRYILNIVDACSNMEFGAWIKLLVVPLAGWRNALDLAPQLPPVAVHVFLGININNGNLIFQDSCLGHFARIEVPSESVHQVCPWEQYYSPQPYH